MIRYAYPVKLKIEMFLPNVCAIKDTTKIIQLTYEKVNHQYYNNAL